jgi:hypothetical protein
MACARSSFDSSIVMAQRSVGVAEYGLPTVEGGPAVDAAQREVHGRGGATMGRSLATMGFSGATPWRQG